MMVPHTLGGVQQLEGWPSARCSTSFASTSRGGQDCSRRSFGVLRITLLDRSAMWRAKPSQPTSSSVATSTQNTSWRSLRSVGVPGDSADSALTTEFRAPFKGYITVMLRSGTARTDAVIVGMILLAGTFISAMVAVFALVAEADALFVGAISLAAWLGFAGCVCALTALTATATTSAIVRSGVRPHSHRSPRRRLAAVRRSATKLGAQTAGPQPTGG